RPGRYAPRREPPPFVGVARHDSVSGICGRFVVDVRSRREDPRRRKMICGDHPPQLHEFLLPLAWIAETRNTVTELAERELRIVLDVKVQIDEARKDRTPGQVDGFSARRRRDRLARPDRHKAIVLNDD